MNDVTEDDILKAIQEAMDAPADGELPRWEPGTVTTGMIRAKLGLSEYHSNKILGILVDEGRIRADKVLYHDHWGDTTRVKGYRLVQ